MMIAAGLCALLIPQTAHAYIGPGAGIALLGSFFAVFAAALSAFFFVLFSNLLGMIPIDAFIGITGKPLHIGGTSTGNIYVTSALALSTMVLVVFNGLRFSGMAYVAHFCPGPLWLAPLSPALRASEPTKGRRSP